MIVVGILYLVLGRREDSVPSTSGQASLWLCVAGLITVFLTGYVGYFVVDRIWPSFYYTPVAAGKNAWLAGQSLSIALYWVGIIGVLLNVWKVTRHSA